MRDLYDNVRIECNGSSRGLLEELLEVRWTVQGRICRPDSLQRSRCMETPSFKHDARWAAQSGMERETGSSPNRKGVRRRGEVGLLARAIDIFRTSDRVDVGTKEEEVNHNVDDLRRLRQPIGGSVVWHPYLQEDTVLPGIIRHDCSVI